MPISVLAVFKCVLGRRAFCSAVMVLHALCHSSPDRVYVVFVSRSVGGQQTLDRVVAKIERVMTSIHEYFTPVTIDELLETDASGSKSEVRPCSAVGGSWGIDGDTAGRGEMQIRCKIDAEQIPGAAPHGPGEKEKRSKSDGNQIRHLGAGTLDEIQIRSKSDPNQIKTDPKQIPIRFRSDFDPISIRFRSDLDPIFFWTV